MQAIIIVYIVMTRHAHITKCCRLYNALRPGVMLCCSDMLDSLCSRLYDVLRPLIIHVNHLETLAELCSILKVEMLEEHVHRSKFLAFK